MKFIIYIDTSIKGTGVAICSVGNKACNPILWSINHFEKNESSLMLSKFIEDGLKKTNLSLEGLVGIVTSIGPGSYTGIRVGLSWVYGMAFSQRAPIKTCGVSSFKLVSRSLCSDSTKRSIVLLGNTPKFGFMSCSLDKDSSQVSLLDLSSDIFDNQSIEKTADIYVDESWQQMKEHLTRHQFTYISVKRSWIAAKSFQSMLRYIDEDQVLASADSLPVPMYMKAWSPAKR